MDVFEIRECGEIRRDGMTVGKISFDGPYGLKEAAGVWSLGDIEAVQEDLDEANNEIDALTVRVEALSNAVTQAKKALEALS